MKIAIPLVEEKLCAHFGHCEKFALIEVNQESASIIQRTDLVPPPHEPGVLPQWLHEQDVTLIIAGGMGQRAQELFAAKGIKVVVGAPFDDPEQIVNKYLSGKLESGSNLCDH
jgi:predicted Fe-Mo cluster-binding NifX family protein